MLIKKNKIGKMIARWHCSNIKLLVLIPVSDISVFQFLNLLLHVKFQVHIILRQMICATIPRAVNKNKFVLKSMRAPHVKFFEH